MQKTAIVTGANSGIGKETAKSLLQQGYELIMICRNRQKAEAALNEFRSLFRSANIHLFICDLSSINEVRHLSDALKSQFKKIDVLINNAGAIFKKRENSADGFEMTFATNHLGGFQLTNNILPLLHAAGDARIINVASQASKFSKLNFDDLQFEKKFNGGIAYANSKLMNILFTYELARKLEGTTVNVNAMHPGGVLTHFGDSLGTPMKIYRALFGWTMRNAVAGADTILWLATSPEVSGISGKYFKDRKQIKSVRVSYNQDIQKKLWDASEEFIHQALENKQQ